MSSNMTPLTPLGDEILEMLQHLVNAVRNLLGFAYWGYNLTQYGVIKEVRGDNGLNLAIFDDQETTHTFGSFSDMVQFSCKLQSQFELIIQSLQYISIISLIITIIPSKRDNNYLRIKSWPFSSSLHCSPF